MASLSDFARPDLFSARNLIAATAAVVFVLGGFLLLRPSETEPVVVPIAVAEPPPVVEEVEAPAPPPEPNYPIVLVAKQDIRPGVLLAADMVEWQEWRDSLEIEFAVVKDVVQVRDLLGSVVLARIPQGELISPNRLIPPDQSSLVTKVVRSGYRAVTVAVDEATTNARVIYPGDRVDVIVVLPAGIGGELANMGPVAQMLVRDVRVLAVGSESLEIGRHNSQRFSVPGTKPEPPEGGTFTLEVALADVERLTLGASAGRLTLAMRSIRQENDHAPEVSLTGFNEVLRLPKGDDAPPPILPAQVRVIRGGSRSSSNEVVPRAKIAEQDKPRSPE